MKKTRIVRYTEDEFVALLENIVKRVKKQQLSESIEMNENVFKGIFDKIKRFFTGEKMEKIGTSPSKAYSYFQDEDGKKWIGVERADYIYEPGYRQYWVQIYEMSDEEKIKTAAENFKSNNGKYARMVDDPHSGGGEFSGGFTKGDYWPKPVKVVNKQTF